MGFSKPHCLKPGSLLPTEVFNLISELSRLRQPPVKRHTNILGRDPSALTRTPPCQAMKNRPVASFPVGCSHFTSAKPFPSGWCLLHGALPVPAGSSCLSCQSRGGADSRTRQLCSAVMLLSQHTHTWHLTSSWGILWPAVEWALCSRAHVLV